MTWFCISQRISSNSQYMSHEVINSYIVKREELNLLSTQKALTGTVKKQADFLSLELVAVPANMTPYF